MNGFSSFLHAFKKARSLAFLHNGGPFQTEPLSHSLDPLWMNWERKQRERERGHWEAITSCQLAAVRAYIEAHPEMLNEVRSGIRRREEEKEEEEEEKERNSP